MKDLVKEITPKQAKIWLNEFRHENRPISKRNLEKISQAINNGEWVFNGQPIIFSKDGHVLDGQHRLAACVATGKPILSMVISGVSAEAFSTMDCGKQRNSADILAIMGYQNVHVVSTAARLLFWYDDNEGVAYRPARYSNSTIRDRVQEFDGIQEASTAAKDKRLRMLGSIGAFVFVAYHAAKYDQEKCTEFFSKMATGIDLSEGHPILSLRNRLMAAKSTGELMSVVRVAAMTVKAWNAFVTGKQIKLLQWSEPAVFPTIAGTRKK